MDNNLRDLIILGCGGHSKVASDIALQTGYAVKLYIDTTCLTNTFLGQKVSHALPIGYSGAFFVAIGFNWSRQKLFNEFISRNPSASLVPLIHPSAIISKNCTVDDGAIIMPLSVVNSGARVGTGVIVNTKSSIDHDCTLMNFSSIAPGSILGGRVTVGTRSAVCMGATIQHGITIGNDSVVGASSFLNTDIEPFSIAYGVPARRIRSRQAEEGYL